MSKQRKSKLKLALAAAMSVCSVWGLAPSTVQAALPTPTETKTAGMSYTQNTPNKIIYNHSTNDVTGMSPEAGGLQYAETGYDNSYIYGNNHIQGWSNNPGWNGFTWFDTRNGSQHGALLSPLVESGRTTTLYGNTAYTALEFKGVDIKGTKVNRLNDKMSFANIAETASGGLSSSGSTTLLLDDITQASLNEHAKAINSLTDLTWNLYENGMPVPFVSINKKNADGTDVTSTTGNYDGLGAKGNASIAIGIEASTIDSATGAVALGTKAAARGVGTIAIGNSAQTMTGSGAGDNYNISIGDNAKTVGASADGDRSSIALGHNATAGFASQTSNKEGGAIAIGDAASAGNQDAIAIGSNSKTYNGRSVAMGNAAKTFGDKSIAIGQEAKTGAYDANNAPVGSMRNPLLL